MKQKSRVLHQKVEIIQEWYGEPGEGEEGEATEEEALALLNRLENVTTEIIEVRRRAKTKDIHLKALYKSVDG